MGKLKFCRICLVQNVRMLIVHDTHLQEVFEKLTNIPFMTEDSRPMLACVFCYARLKQCHRFKMKCLEAEEILAQMLDGENKHNTLPTHKKSDSCGGFIKTPVHNINIMDGETGVFVVHEVPVEFENEDNICKKDFGEGPSVAQKTKSHMQTKQLGDIITNKKNEKSGCKVISKSDDNPVFTGDPSILLNYVLRPPNNFSKVLEGETYTNNSQVDTSRFNNSDFVTIKDLKCKLCHYKAVDSNDIEKHKLCHKLNVNKCDICQRSFNQKANLKRHILTHIDDKKFKCDQCESKFNHKHILQSHMRVHTGEKPYQCDICNKSFKQQSNMKNHYRTHTGEKPYKCDVCDSSFSQLSNLKGHIIRKHTNERRYKCDICQSSFNQKSHLQRHSSKHIGGESSNCEKSA